jgi:hypothetical protein
VGLESLHTCMALSATEGLVGRRNSCSVRRMKAQEETGWRMKAAWCFTTAHSAWEYTSRTCGHIRGCTAKIWIMTWDLLR